MSSSKKPNSGTRQRGSADDATDRGLKLYKAAQKGDLRKVQQLVEQEPGLVDARHPKAPNWTPLMAAVWNNHSAVCQCLLDKGANVELKDSELGIDALQVAAQQGSEQCAQLLIRRSQANRQLLDSRSNDGRTPLIRCAWRNRLGVGRLLLEAGADPNLVEGDGFSALHFCAQEGHLEFAKTLVRYQAKLDLRTSSRKSSHTPFTLAAFRQHQDMLELLSKSGADVFHRSANGDAVDIAERTNNPELLQCVQRLLDAGRNQQGQPQPQPQPQRLATDSQSTYSPVICELQGDQQQPTGSVLPIIDSNGSYSIQSNPPGLCVVFNNEFRGAEQERKGSCRDVEKVRAVFQELRFRVSVHIDTELAELQAVLQSLALRGAYDCFVCFVMTHGSRGNRIVTADGANVPVRSIVKPFCSSRSQWENKPKLFFFQACRPEGSPESSQDEWDGGEQNKQDVLVAHSAAFGNSSSRDETEGSLFVQKLCDVIKRRDCHLVEMLQKVRMELSSSSVSQQETPEDYSTLRANVCFP